MTKYFILFSVLFALTFGCYESNYPISEDQIESTVCEPVECADECVSSGAIDGYCEIVYYGASSETTCQCIL